MWIQVLKKTKQKKEKSSLKRGGRVTFSSHNKTNATITSQGHLEEKTTGKQLCTDVITEHVAIAENVYPTHFIFSLLRQTGNQHAASLFCFPGDISVIKRVDLKFDLPSLDKVF